MVLTCRFSCDKICIEQMVASDRSVQQHICENNFLQERREILMLSTMLMNLMALPMTDGVSAEANPTAFDFSFEKFFTTSTNSLSTIGGAFIVLLGLVMIVVAGWQIAKGLIGHGKAQTNWFIVIGLLLAGGIFMAGGISWLTSLAKGVGNAAQGLGEGKEINTILPMLFPRLFLK